MELFEDEIMYDSLVKKDASFEGLFYAGVKTTGIFCRPTCRAKKPKRENVEFFKTSKDALAHGYRPCKICKPLEKPDKTPDYIKQVLDEISADPSKKLKEQDLRDRGIEPNTIRRWFLKYHGMTFHSYQRMLRINTAFKKIKNGESITNAAFDAGYDSLSGFNESFKSIFGVSPTNSREQQLVDITRLETPLGPMIAGANSEGICLLEFSDRRMLESEFKHLAKRLNANLVLGNNRHFETLKIQLSEYFSGKRKKFDLPLHTPGSPFQQSVWEQLQTIPYGTTRSYKEQATAIEKPEAIRAVANANGMNRIAIVIPCHRVIGSDGKLTGYGGGLWRKKYLLDFERNNLQ
jgi:AraC family transcriptional regulator, regulatory protein of adaptative response / methylated-DNA-[protein]-cysteine methyltransferase